jgi:hypothetical protein
MKTFNKSYLPETVKYNGNTYTENTTITTAMNKSGTPAKQVLTALKSTGKKGILINVLNKRLKGVKDLHGNFYEPRPHIYTT